MTIEVDTITAPADWASYLVNGDCSGMTDEDIAACDAWQARIEPFYVVDIARDADGEADEPRFSWSYGFHGGTAQGGDVVDYVVHKLA